MKKLTALMLGCMLSLGFTALGETNEIDQKWLEAVQKMVAKGENKIATPNESRVNLLKEWGSKNGYSVKVTKTDTSYSIEVSKNLAQN